jgi:RNA polymerase sigma factor (sigma-70 family)
VRALALYCGDSLLAEDLAQEALAVALRDWGRIRSLHAREAYVVRIGMNLCNSFIRRRAAERRAYLKTLSAEPVSQNDSDQSDAAVVREAVVSLPKRQRTALILRYFLDLSVARTSELMDVSEGTVKACTSNAIANLRTRLEKEGSAF